MKVETVTPEVVNVKWKRRVFELEDTTFMIKPEAYELEFFAYEGRPTSTRKHYTGTFVLVLILLCLIGLGTLAWIFHR